MVAIPSHAKLGQLAVPAAALYVIGTLEVIEGIRQRRRGVRRALVVSEGDRDPTSTWLLTFTWWPAGIAGLAAAALLPQLAVSRDGRRCWMVFGLVAAGAGVALRQWAIATLGRFFVGHVVVQPDQTVVTSGPYRWLRHPSYAGQWLEMIGVGMSTGNGLSLATCTLLPLVGIVARIRSEERELAADLPGYSEFLRGKARLLPFVW